MNWSFLHSGWLGIAEAALIALAMGALAFGVLHRLARANGWPEGRALGWACLLALLAGSSLDFFYLLRLFLLDARFPARVELALQGIHDPERLGIRFVAEALGALAGALGGWVWAESRRSRSRPPA